MTDLPVGEYLLYLLSNASAMAGMRAAAAAVLVERRDLLPLVALGDRLADGHTHTHTS